MIEIPKVDSYNYAKANFIKQVNFVILKYKIIASHNFPKILIHLNSISFTALIVALSGA